jgi:hypothetical protein
VPGDLLQLAVFAGQLGDPRAVGGDLGAGHLGGDLVGASRHLRDAGDPRGVERRGFRDGAF